MNYFEIDKQKELLIETLAGGALSLPDWWSDYARKRTIYNIAREHELDTLLSHRIADMIGWDNLPIDWLESHNNTRKRIMAYLAELDHIADILDSKGIRLVALKNGGIARGIYQCPGCCPMGDLDVLVLRKHFRRAHRLLLEEGYYFEYRSALEKVNISAAERSGSAEYWKVLPSGHKMWLELQWRPVAGRWISSEQEPTVEELLARSISVPGTAVRMLSPEDNLLQVSLHTAKHSYMRAPGIRLHLDVDRIVRHYPEMDWNVFIGRVSKYMVKTAVYFSLLIPKELLHTPIPETVLMALRPPEWKERLIVSWLKTVGLFNPQQRKFGNLGYIIFNSLLYDDIQGLLRGAFPNRPWMRERYNIRNDMLLPFYHGKRLLDLLFRRTGT